MFKNIKNGCKFVINKVQNYIASVAVPLALVLSVAVGFVSTSANAVLNAGVATGLTGLQTDFDSLLSLAYPVMIAITVALVIFGLVKSFIHKAAGK